MSLQAMICALQQKMPTRARPCRPAAAARCARRGLTFGGGHLTTPRIVGERPARFWRKREPDMARRCALSGKGVMVGNNVSHANNKTKRRFLPNLHRHSVYSETLGESIRLRVSIHGLRTVEHRGGIDNFLLETRDADLSGDLRRLKRRIRAARAAAESQAAEAS